MICFFLVPFHDQVFCYWFEHQGEILIDCLIRSIHCVSQRLVRTAQRDCLDTTLWDPTTTSPHTGTASFSYQALLIEGRRLSVQSTAHLTFFISDSFSTWTRVKTFLKLLPSKGIMLSVHLVQIVKWMKS